MWFTDDPDPSDSDRVRIFGVRIDRMRVRGKIDRTPEGLYVGTDFWCLLGVALVPQRSKIYTGESTTKYLDFTIPLNPRSVLMAYARSWSLTAAILACAAGILLSVGGAEDLGITPAAVIMVWTGAVASSATFWITRRLHALATPARAAEIRRTLNLGIEPKLSRRGFEIAQRMGDRPSVLKQ